MANVTKEEDVKHLVNSLNGQVEILANVAGIMDHFVPLGELSDELWDRVMDVNLNGVMRLTRAVLPVMEKVGSGAIVNWRRPGGRLCRLDATVPRGQRGAITGTPWAAHA